jgi:protein-S-isoprenylcysteine O-methyltransferase Ste14
MVSAALVETALSLLLLVICLFGSAGTWAWPAAWVLVAGYAVQYAAALVLVDRELLRVRAGRERGMKSWDPPLATSAFLFLFPLLFVVAGLDAKRFQWSPVVPVPIRGVAFVVFVAGQAFAFWAVRVNRFFAKFVRVQHERHHTVVTEGPYAYVRHPGYAGSVVAQMAVPIILGSLYALIPAAVGTLLLALRAWLEDRTLRAELAGYREFAQRVRWRLLPGCW